MLFVVLLCSLIYACLLVQLFLCFFVVDCICGFEEGALEWRRFVLRWEMEIIFFLAFHRIMLWFPLVVAKFSSLPLPHVLSLIIEGCSDILSASLVVDTLSCLSLSLWGLVLSFLVDAWYLDGHVCMVFLHYLLNHCHFKSNNKLICFCCQVIPLMCLLVSLLNLILV